MTMTIRTFQPGDDLAQVSIYNEAAADLPKFKRATVDEVRRRCLAKDFDRGTRFYAIEGGRPVAYTTFHPGGRVSYPWCRKGQEQWADPLLEQVLKAMRRRDMASAFAAYRADWEPVRDFFLAHGFEQKREMLNYVLDLIEMPTPAARPETSFTPLTPDDLDTLLASAPTLFRVDQKGLRKALFHNPYYPPESLFALRHRAEGKLLAVGIMVADPAYSNPKLVDTQMPCFRLGAFGTEGLTHKRINGLFSFVVTEPRDTNRLGLDLLGHAAYRLQETQVETVAGQVPSDVPNLVRFYQQYFRAQGRFPLYERQL
jgi:hypothetical protein